MTATVDETLQLLQTPSADGMSFEDHITELILQIIETHPADSTDRIEDYSEQLRVSGPPKTLEEEEIRTDDRILDRYLKAALEKNKELLKATAPTAGEEQGPSDVALHNPIDEGIHFERLGVGLGQEELLQISLHLRSYFETQPLKSVRLWGKITGLENDYYIAEGEPSGDLGEEEEGEEKGNEEENAEEAREEEEGAEAEEELAQGEPTIEEDPDQPASPPPFNPPPAEDTPAEGREEKSPNQFVYWACTGPTDSWHRLPDITPAMLRGSRLIVRDFTGDLNAPVSKGFPVFEWKEKHFLRAQIARISHSTSIVPVQSLSKGEGEEEEEEGGAKRVQLTVDLLSNLSEWVHSKPPILVQGRVRKYPPQEGEEEEEEEAKKKKKELKLSDLHNCWEGKDEVEPINPDAKPSRIITMDEKIKGTIPAFSIRKDHMLDNTPVLIKSNRWPGAYTIVYGTKTAQWSSLYIGNGRKYTAEPYSLPPPADIPDEYEDMEELIDPTVEDEEKLKPKPEEEEGKEEGEEGGAEEGAEEGEEEES
ncbi:putative Flagellar radial spoke protein 4 [Blattamonas nauphoetae]|uniref:Flagellar radial spoke protein 4 n=1 Tax=Blattamonas nauphoetae TaxID=2049346 RepID=A0ABQ9XAC5_9EUKA|nr:putative Flagellar radial spoke protein 4 [Blattamonas nauphoetae]